MSKVFRTAFFIFALLFALSFVSAVSVSGPFFAASGQCETTMQKYSVCAGTAGTYFISMQGTGGSWVSIAPTSLGLSQSTCSDVYAFITPDCYANSGTYAPRMIISGPEDYNNPITIEVNQAHTFTFGVSPLSITTAPCAENILNATIKNTGKFKDEFVISQSAAPSGWIVSSGGKIVVEPYSLADFLIKVTPVCSADAGGYNISLNAANTRTNSSSQKSISVAVTNVVPLSVNGLFESKKSLDIKLCRDTEEAKKFDVNNISSINDTFTFYLLDSNGNSVKFETAHFDKERVFVAAGKSAELNLLIGKNPLGAFLFTFRAHSEAFDKNYDVKLNMGVENCYEMSLLRESSDAGACIGKVSQKFVLKNSGTKPIDANVLLYSGVGLIESKSVSVSPSSNSEVYFILSPVSAGSVSYSAIAKTFFAESKVDFNYSFEKCFDSTIEAQNIEYCKESVVDFNALIKNSGTKGQEFAVLIDAPWLSVTPNKVSVLPAGTQAVKIKGVAQASIANTYTIKAVSAENTLSKTISFVEKSKDNCRSFDYSITADVADVNCGGGRIIDLNLTNTGAFDTQISLLKVFPQWVSFSEGSISLKPAQTKTIFVYVSPPAGTIGKISGLITATNDSNISKDINLSLNVLLGSCSALSADGNLNSAVSGLKTISRKEITIDFVLTNDSNSGYNVYDINAPDFNVSVDFNKGVFVDANKKLDAKITFKFLEGEEPKDQNVFIAIKTSAGDLNKIAFVKFSDASTQIPITGFFGAFGVMTIGGLLVILLIVLALLALVKANANEKKKPKLGK